MAVIYLTATLINKCFNFNLNTDGILELLINAEKEKVEERDMDEHALEAIKEFVYKFIIISPQMILSQNVNKKNIYSIKYNLTNGLKNKSN